MKTITTIIPVFNEEENLAVLHERLDRMAAALKDVRFEFLLVDDHSSDRPLPSFSRRRIGMRASTSCVVGR
jgi:glycosyltransferase involved in cell wall biosynthesis